MLSMVVPESRAALEEKLKDAQQGIENAAADMHRKLEAMEKDSLAASQEQDRVRGSDIVTL